MWQGCLPVPEAQWATGSEGASGRDSGVQPIWRQGSFVHSEQQTEGVCRECAGKGRGTGDKAGLRILKTPGRNGSLDSAVFGGSVELLEQGFQGPIPGDV